MASPASQQKMNKQINTILFVVNSPQLPSNDAFTNVLASYFL